MKHAKPSDWKVRPLPSRVATIPTDREYSEEDIVRIRHGLVPEQMEDKWFIYWQDDALFFHRSWTGICFCIARFATDGNKWRMVKVCVNRDPDQHTESSDDEDMSLVYFLIDVLLLRKDSVLPNSEKSSVDDVLKGWSLVGRAMLGKHPNDME